MAPHPDLRIEIASPSGRTEPVRRALVIALQYPGLPESWRLQHTYEDADHLQKMLIAFDYKAEDITILKDDGVGILPTRDVVIQAMKDLVSDSIPGDRFVFHFSGHGGQQENVGIDKEDDGKDETIWPADVQLDENNDVIKVKNDILDDLLSETLIPPVCLGAHLVIIFDACHSGTAADLDHWLEGHPKKYRRSRRRALNVNKPKLVQAWSPAATASTPGTSSQLCESILSPVQDEIAEADIADGDTENVLSFYDTPRIVSWAACKDPQNTGSLPTYGGLFVKVFTDMLYKAATLGEAVTHGKLLEQLESTMVDSIVELLQTKLGHTVSREAVAKWHELPKPQLLGLPDLDKVKNILIKEMF